jgi:hypothetical protein
MPDWIGNVGGVVALVIGLGAIVQYLRGSRDKGTITTLEQNNKALNERVTLLEGDLARVKTEAAADKKAMNERVRALERENASLLAQRPSAEAIEDLNEKADRLEVELSRHDIETRRLLKDMTS